MDDYEIYKRASKYNDSMNRKYELFMFNICSSRYTRSAPTSVALEPIVVFGSNRVSTASSYKSAKSMTDSMKQNKKFPKLSTIASISHSQSAVTSQSQQQQNPSNFQPTPPPSSSHLPPPISAILTPDKRIKTASSSLTSPSLSHRSYTPSSHITSSSKPPVPPLQPPVQPPPQPPPLHLLLLQQQQQQRQPPPFPSQYPYNDNNNNNPYQPYQPPLQPQPPYYPPPNSNNPLQSPQYPLQSPNYPSPNLYQQQPFYQQQQQQFQPPYYPFPQQPLQAPPPIQRPIYYPPPKQNNSTICVPQSEVPDKIIYREIQEERSLSPRQYFIYRNGCALRIMKWYRKQKQIKMERKVMKIADDVTLSSSSSAYNSNNRYEDGSHLYNEMVVRQADQFLIEQQTRKNRSLLGILTKEIYEEDINEFLKEIIIETIHEEVTDYFSRHDVVYNKRISDPPIFDIDPERIEIRSLIREGIMDRLISHGLLNKLSKDTNSEDNFYDLP